MSLACVSAADRPLGSISVEIIYGCCKHLRQISSSRLEQYMLITNLRSCIIRLFRFDFLIAELATREELDEVRLVSAARFLASNDRIEIFAPVMLLML